jgi:Ca2+-binding RTX toxin-like protein
MTTLNESELATLASKEAQAQAGQIGFWQIYEWLADVLIAKGTPASDASIIWLRGATEANAGRGTMAALIRTYTETQYQLRYGTAVPAGKMQKASDAVAQNLLDDLLGKNPPWPRGQVPDINRIGQADATAVGEVLFNADPLDTAAEGQQNSAWAGALLFGPLGSDQTSRLTSTGISASEVDSLNDIRDVLYAAISYAAGIKAAVTLWPVQGPDQRGRDAATMTGTLFAYISGEGTAGDLWDMVSLGATGNVGSILRVIGNVGPSAFLDMLMGTIAGKSLIGSTSDANFSVKAKTFFDAYGPNALQSIGAKLLPTNASALADKARTDVHARAALAALSIVSLEVNAAVADQFSLYNPATGIGNITQNWINDRAAFTANLYKKLDGLGGVVNGGENLRFFDLGSNTQVLVGAGSEARVQFFFGAVTNDTANGGGFDDHLYGGDGADTLLGLGGNDYLQGDSGSDQLDGGDGKDVLLGGSGADTLDGGRGDDTLRGGIGADVYKFAPNWGADIIEDGDGIGVIEVEGLGVLSGEGTKKVAENVWQTADKKINYTLVPLSEGKNDLYISFSDRIDLVVIRNWSPENPFGIILPMPVVPPDESTTLMGDFIKQENGTAYVTAATGYANAGLQAGAADVINGTENAESIHGLDGNDGLAGGGGDDFIDGGGGSDLILGGFGRDTIFGGAGNDYIFGSGAGKIDRPTSTTFTPPASNGIELARGFSWVVFEKPGSTPEAGSTRHFIGAGIYPGTPGPGGNWYVESTGNVIDGGAGDDDINAGTGADVVHGGDDNDTIMGMGGADVLFGDDGDDVIWGDGNAESSSANFAADEDHGSDTMVGGSGDDTLVGQGGADVLSGGADNDDLWGDGDEPADIHGNDTLDGGDGVDRLEGGGRDDVLFGGSGNDRIWGDNSHADVVTGTYQGADYLDGEQGNDQLHGGGNDDTVLGGEGDDLLWGDDLQTVTPLTAQGRDYLDGGDGNDQVVGGGGDDTLFGGAGNDLMFGDDEEENVAASAHGNDILDGQGGDDVLLGGGGNDQLNGGDGNDDLFGDAGNDTLIGGSGSDYLAGGAGDDTYVFATGESARAATGESETLLDNEGHNTIVLDGALPTTLVVLTDGNGALVLDTSPTDRIAIVGGAFNSDNIYRLADGTTYNYSTLIGNFAPGVIRATDAAGRQHVMGGKTDDYVIASPAGAILSGGRGNDSLVGLGGDVTFLYGLGGGADTITASTMSDNSGIAAGNRLRLGDGIAANDLRLSTDAFGNLVLLVGSSAADRITLKAVNQRVGGVAPIEHIEFADGSIVSLAQLRASASAGSEDNDNMVGSNVNDILKGHAGNDTLIGWGGNDVLEGDAGKDKLEGGAGNDTLEGGAGDDTIHGDADDDVLLGGEGFDFLHGGEGNDTLDGGGPGRNVGSFLEGAGGNDVYIFKRGNGRTFVSEFDRPGVSLDRILLGAGISPSDVTLTRGDDYQLYVRINGTDDVAEVNRHFDGSGEREIEEIVFSDGTVWDLAQIASMAQTPATPPAGSNLSLGDGDDVITGGLGNDTLVGGAGNDTLRGGEGNDLLNGGAGNDVYLFELGDGKDTISNFGDATGPVDELRFGLGIAPSDLILTMDIYESNLLLSVRGRSDSVLIERFFDDESSGTGRQGIDRVVFADGTIWHVSDLESRARATTNEDDIIYGSVGHDVVEGLAGFDQISGGGGDDVLDGGADDDHLMGGDGLDLLRGGAQNDDLEGQAGNDTLLGNDGDDSLDGGAGSDLLQGGAGDDWLDANGQSYDASGRDTLDGGAGNDKLFGRDGDEVYLFGRGDGQDQIYGATMAPDFDVLRFKAGVLPSQVIIKRVFDPNLYWGASYLELSIAGTDDRIRTIDFFDDQGGLDAYAAIQQVQFDDGTIWDAYTIAAMATSQASLHGTGGADVLQGGSKSEMLLGLAGNDVVFGAGGGDWLDGGTGDDTLSGGLGNDSYIVDSMSDVVVEALDEGIDTVASTETWALGANIENLRLMGDLEIDAIGNALDNILTGNAAANLLDGQCGADTLNGGAGDDRYIVDNTGDVVSELQGGGLDTVESALSYTLGDYVENLVLTGAGLINAMGNGMDNLLLGNVAGNSLVGGGGNDTLDGGAGDDTMAGGVGNDTYIVDSRSDVISESSNAGTDAVISSASFTLASNIERLFLSGDAAISATGNALANILEGNAGNNVLDGAGGNDTMRGSFGDDTYFVDTAGDVVVEDMGQGVDLVQSAVAHTLSANVENLTLTGTRTISGTGNALDNMLTGNSAANTLTGHEGNDVLDGKGGTDTMKGGAGDDTYDVDSTSDVVTELAGEGVDEVRSNVTYTLGANIERLMLTGSNAINGTGNASDNMMVGNAAANNLNGGAGSDTLEGGMGNDTYIVDSAGDLVTELESEGIDLVQSGVTYTLGANVDNLTLTGTGAINGTGNALDNALTGNTGANTLAGNGGNDTLDGKAGADTMKGGTGNDTYYVDNVSDVVTELAGEGNDTVLSTLTHTLAANVENLRLNAAGAINGTGNTLDNILYAGAGNNILNGLGGLDTASYLYAASAVTVNLASTGAQATGGSGSDTLQNIENLTGSGFNDMLSGNAAANVLDGGAGNDALAGGSGNDTYRMGRGNGSDVINENDATAGNADVALFGPDIATDQLWFRQSGNNLEVSVIGTSDKFTLSNWYLGNQYHVEQFRTGDGRLLSDSNVQNLVQAMATFSPPAAGQTTLPPNYQSSLNSVIAANWQ